MSAPANSTQVTGAWSTATRTTWPRRRAARRRRPAPWPRRRVARAEATGARGPCRTSSRACPRLSGPLDARGWRQRPDENGQGGGPCRTSSAASLFGPSSEPGVAIPAAPPGGAAGCQGGRTLGTPPEVTRRGDPRLRRVPAERAEPFEAAIGASCRLTRPARLGSGSRPGALREFAGFFAWTAPSSEQPPTWRFPRTRGAYASRRHPGRGASTASRASRA